METLTFFFDRCFGASLPEAIRRAKPPFGIEYQGDRKGIHKFKQDTPDDVWLSAVGRLGWFVFSHDRKFHQIEIERSAIDLHRIGCFYLWGNNATTWDKLRCFMRAHDNVIETIRQTPRPFVFDVGQSGRVTAVELR